MPCRGFALIYLTTTFSEGLPTLRDGLNPRCDIIAIVALDKFHPLIDATELINGMSQ